MSVTKYLSVIALLGLTSIFLGGCNNSTFGNMFSQAQEQALGDRLADEVNSQEKIDHDPILNGHVEAIAAPIFEQARKMRPGIPYQIRIIDDPEINAFSIPGGYIYIYKGLLDKIGNDDDALACVIGHESAHIVRRHVVKQLTDASVKGELVNIVGFTTRNFNAMNVADDVYELDQLHFSRDDEYEADKYGLMFAYSAGYDIDGMLRLFKVLEAEEAKSSEPPAYALDHPLSKNREKRAEILIEILRSNDGIYPGMTLPSDPKSKTD